MLHTLNRDSDMGHSAQPRFQFAPSLLGFDQPVYTYSLSGAMDLNWLSTIRVKLVQQESRAKLGLIELPVRRHLRQAHKRQDPAWVRRHARHGALKRLEGIRVYRVPRQNFEIDLGNLHRAAVTKGKRALHRMEVRIANRERLFFDQTVRHSRCQPE